MTTEPFQRIRAHWEQQLPFVVYRKPNEQRIHSFLQSNDQLFTINDFTERGFVMAPFNDLEKALLIPESGSEKLTFNFEHKVAPGENTVGMARRSALPQQRREHLSLLQKGLKKLEEGVLDKVVLSRKEELEYPGKDPFYLFHELLTAYPTAFVYLWYHPKIGCWMAATPEVLLTIEGNNFRTMALAGTRKYVKDQPVVWAEKERKEQQFVTDEILEKIGDFVTDLAISETRTVRAGNLWHLRTDIQGRTKAGTGLRGLISTLHPTPAVCGLPRQEARNFIRKEEGYDREFYTGFLGELNLHDHRQRSRNSRNIENLAYRSLRTTSALYVNLRCMKLEGNSAFIFVGGGITRDSGPESEWEETVNKAETLKRVLLGKT